MRQMVPLFLRRALLGAAAFGLTCAAVPAAQAQTPTQQRNTAMLEARKRVTEAKQIVDDIKKDEERIKDKRRADFETKEEWKNTVANHKKTKAGYEKAKTDAMAAVKKSEKYKAATKSRDAAQVRYDELSKKRPVEPNAIAKAGTVLANENMAMKKMEAEVLERDEKVLEAKDAFEAAQKELDELNQEVEAALAADPDYLQVQQQLEQAETQFTAAKDAATQMQKAEADQRKAARPPKAPKAPRMPRGGRGGPPEGY